VSNTGQLPPRLAGGMLGDPFNPAGTNFPAADSFTVAGYLMPGKWTLTSADKVFGWQINKAYGLSGATVFPAGDELVVPKFHGEIWADADAAEFKFIRKILLIKPTFIGASGAVNALGIDHPELKIVGVTAVVVQKIGVLTHAGKGKWVADIEFLQYRSPIPAPPIQAQVIPDATQNPPNPAAVAQQVELSAAQIELAITKAAP
jgi:hypothetical protein